MYSITKEFRFESGHRLPFHHAGCKNVHGHSYKVFITVSAPDLDKNGLVTDFGNLKPVKEWIDEYFDHAYIGHAEDPILKYSQDLNLKNYSMPDSEYPTAENMAKLIYRISNKILTCRGSVTKVVLYETETSKAEYTGEVWEDRRCIP